MPEIRLPDGSKRQFESNVSVAEVAQNIGAGLARAALAGRVNDQLVDLSFVIHEDSDLAIITDKNPEGLEVIRHSTAHLLAYAVKELFPEAQVTIGPVIEHGFYYDFSYTRPFTPEDLEKIEKKMMEIANRDLPITRKILPRNDAVKYFKSIKDFERIAKAPRSNCVLKSCSNPNSEVINLTPIELAMEQAIIKYKENYERTSR